MRRCSLCMSTKPPRPRLTWQLLRGGRAPKSGNRLLGRAEFCSARTVPTVWLPRIFCCGLYLPAQFKPWPGFRALSGAKNRSGVSLAGLAIAGLPARRRRARIVIVIAAAASTRRTLPGLRRRGAVVLLAPVELRTIATVFGSGARGRGGTLLHFARCLLLRCFTGLWRAFG